MEKWDAYDGHLNKIDGLTLIRGEEIPDGIFHVHEVESVIAMENNCSGMHFDMCKKYLQENEGRE